MREAFCGDLCPDLPFPLPEVFVETLDKCFENVCELDLIFHMDKVGHGLGVLRTNHHSPQSPAPMGRSRPSPELRSLSGAAIGTSQGHLSGRD